MQGIIRRELTDLALMIIDPARDVEVFDLIGQTVLNLEKIIIEDVSLTLSDTLKEQWAIKRKLEKE